jgi:hypothetical protein
LAPEQALDSHAVDIRADIYSLGATLYYCLTGRTPFHEGTVAQKLIWHQTRQPKSVTTYRQDVPEGFLAVLEKMMAKQPEQRYQTPAELVEALIPFTQEPIPPPSPDEMPKLSPAALGQSPSDVAPAPPPTPASTAPSSKQRTNWPVPSKAAPAPTRKTPTPKSVPRAPAEKEAVTAPAARPVAVKSDPETVEAAAPAAVTTEPEGGLNWEALTSETQDAVGLGNTATKSGSRRPVARGIPAQPLTKLRALLRRIPPARRAWWIAGATLGLVLLSLLVLWLMSRPARVANIPPTPPASSSTTWRVARSGQPDTLPLVARALQKAKPGDRIVLAEDVEETLHFDGIRTGKRDITIEAERDGITWRLPKAGGDKQFFVIGDASGLRLKGFTLDGQGIAEDLVVLSGRCPGLTLEGLTLKGFRESAVKIINCAGTADQPVRLSALRIQTQQPTEHGIVFHLNPSMKDIPINQHILVEDCSFDGPSRAPIATTGPKTYEVVDFKNVPLPVPAAKK